LFSQAINLEDF
jgi:serine/threonine protein kinase